MAMTHPSKACVTVTCENFVVKNDVVMVCGQWCIVANGSKEFPYCRRCKSPNRAWRLVTLEELQAFDEEFARRVAQWCGPSAKE